MRHKNNIKVNLFQKIDSHFPKNKNKRNIRI